MSYGYRHARVKSFNKVNEIEVVKCNHDNVLKLPRNLIEDDI